MSHMETQWKLLRRTIVFVMFVLPWLMLIYTSWRHEVVMQGVVDEIEAVEMEFLLNRLSLPKRK